jgi:hypothetical protein
MRQLLLKLWHDDAGAIIPTEFLIVGSTLVIGATVGVTSLRNALNSELAELGNTILGLSQEYTIPGLKGGGAEVQGSATIDKPGHMTPPKPSPAPTPSLLDVPQDDDRQP